MEDFEQFPQEEQTSEGVNAPLDLDKAEEELEAMLNAQGIEQPEPRIQPEQQPAPQEEQPAPAAEAEEPADTIDNPIGQWMEDRNVDLRDLVDNVFQGDQRSREEIAEDRREIRTEAAEQNQEIAQQIDEAEDIPTVVARETTRAVVGGVAGVVEQPVRFAQQIMGQEATFNLGIAENKTAIGEFGRSTITMLGLMKGAAGMGVKVGGGASVASRLSTEAARGAVADFIMEEGDGNLSNLLGDMNPELEDTFLTALAHDDDDNIYIRKLKNMAEGGVFGIAVDGIGEFIGALRAARKAKPGGRAAVEKKLEEYFQPSLDLGNTSTKLTKKLGAHDVFTEASDGDYSRLKELDAYELKSLVEDYNLAQFSSPKDVLRNVDPNVSYEALGEGIFSKQLPNGTTIDWSLRDVSDRFSVSEPDARSQQYARDVIEARGEQVTPEALQQELTTLGFTPDRYDAPLANRNVQRIDWDLDDVDADVAGLGRDGTRLFKQFSELVSDKMQPGQIMVTEAAGDGFGNAGKSAAQEKRLKTTRRKWFNDNKQAATEAYNKVVGEGEFEDLELSAQVEQMANMAERGELPKFPTADDVSIRRKLYERAGFSSPDIEGKMYGVVLKDKKGRAKVQALDINGDIDAQIEAAKASSTVQPKIENFDDADSRRIIREGVSKDPERLRRWKRVESLEQMGVKPEWADHAAVVPEYFEPGARIPEPNFHPSVYEQLRALDPNDPDAGATLNPFTGETPPTGTMVAIDAAVLEDVTPENVAEFIAENYDMLNREDVFLGSWIDPLTKTPTVELSRRVEDVAEAEFLARLFDQWGTFRMDDFHYKPTYGTDALRKTKRRWGINMQEAPAGKESGIGERIRESEANNAQSVETNLYEPNERAAVTTSSTPTQTALSLIDAADSTNARRMATDETFRKILAASDVETALQGVVRAVADNLDVDAIYDKLRAANNGKQEWVLESIPVLEEFLEKSRDVNDFSSLTELLKNADGTVVKQYMTDEGALAVRVLAKDTANQISDIARNMQDVDAVSGDTYRQAEMLLDRMEVLSKMNIEASYKAGSQLQRRNASKFNYRKILGEGDGDAARKQKKSDETITKLREALADGDPQAKADFQTLADAVALVDGNPEKIMSFWQKWRTVGAAGLRTAMYNGYLSASQSQLRNLVGNEFNIMLRPAAQAIGFAAQGNYQEARIQLAAYHGLLEMHGEAFNIFKKSFASSAEDTSQVVRFDEGQPGTGRQLVENMKASAKTKGEQAAAEIVDMYYSVFNNPMMRMPTRGLQAADDAARTLVARMELKKDAMRNSFEKGQGFKVDEKRYAKLVEMKIDGEGNLLDQRLLDTAKEVTFQEDLKGFSKTLQDLSNTNPAVKLMFPFVKTPVNIMRQTASYIPGPHQRYIKDFQDALDAGDVEKIAMYKGRQAIGLLTMSTAMGLAINGLITGKGPQDPQKRELWLKNNQPNSIKIPGVGWVSYETIEPLNTILSASVDLLQIAAAGNQSAYDWSWLQFGYSMAAAVVDKSYLRGFIDTAALMNVSDPRWADIASRKVAQTGNTVLLPLSGLRAQLSRALQPGKQEFDNAWQREMQRAIPSTQRLFGVDRVDILENKQMQFGDYATNLWNTLTPFDVTNDNPDSVAKQLGELGLDITLSFSDTFKGIDLTAREKQQFNQYLADTGIGKELKALLADEEFDKDKEAWKESGKGHNPPPKWLTLIHTKLRAAKRDARAAMLAENPTFADKVELNQVETDLIKSGRYNQEPPEKIQEQLKFILEY